MEKTLVNKLKGWIEEEGEKSKKGRIKEDKKPESDNIDATENVSGRKE